MWPTDLTYWPKSSDYWPALGLLPKPLLELHLSLFLCFLASRSLLMFAILSVAFSFQTMSLSFQAFQSLADKQPLHQSATQQNQQHSMLSSHILINNGQHLKCTPTRFEHFGWVFTAKLLNDIDQESSTAVISQVHQQILTQVYSTLKAKLE